MRKLNVRLAAILLGSLVALLVVIYFVNRVQVRRNAGFYRSQAEAALEEAKQAEEDGDVQRTAQRYDDAVNNYTWYVRLRPDDLDALEDLALLLADLVSSRRDRRTFGLAYTRLEEVLREDPTRSESRRKLAQLMMEIGRWADAEGNVRVLLKGVPDDADALQMLAMCQEALREDAAAVETYQRLIQAHPDRLMAYVRLATLLRDRVDRPAEADQYMTSLIETNPDSAEAHRIYGGYLLAARRGESDSAVVTQRRTEALEHVRRAIELEPDEAEGYRLAALCHVAMDQVDEARQSARRAIELKPDDQRMYSALVDVELRAGRKDEAVAVLREGLEAAEEHADLLWTLANLLIDGARLDDARKAIEQLQAAGYPEGRIGYLRARVALIESKWKEAIDHFEEARPALAAWPSLVKQADFWTAECYQRLGNPDMRLKFLRQAVEVDPFFAPALAGIAEAELAVGQVDEAYRQYLNLIKMGGSGATPQFARIMVLRELNKPAGQRAWAPIETMLQRAAEAVPDSPQIPVYRAEVFVAQGKLDEARRVLVEARDRMPQAVELWAVLASLAARQDNWDEAVAVIKQAEEHVQDKVALQLCRARYFVDRHGRAASGKLREMAEQADSLSPSDKLRLWRGMMAESVRAGDTAQVEKLARRILAVDPDDVELRFLLFEIAVRQRDVDRMRRELDELLRITGKGAAWLYGQAVCSSLATRGADDPSLDEALEYLRQARALRPSWGRAVLLTAGIYDQKGDFDRALDMYLQAVRMGEKNPRALRRAIQLLYAQRRFDEAIRLMEDFGSVPEELTRAYSEMKFRLESFDEALELARKAAVDSQDPTDHIWLGQVCMVESLRARQRGQLVEAEKYMEDAEMAFRKATEVADDIATTWAALIRFYTETNQSDEAEKALAEAEARLPADKAAIGLAQCFEAMGDMERARGKYEEALAAAPDDPVAVRHAASFYLRTGNNKAGEEKLRALVDGSVPAGKSDRIWSRRRLAMLLAARPGYQSRQQALELIEQNLSEDQDSVEDRRVKAEMLAADPSAARRQQAIDELRDLVARKESATAEDLFDLYQLYAGEGNWVEASRQMRRLLADHGPQPRYLLPYVQALLDRRELSEAGRWLDRLEEVLPNSYVVAQLRAELLVLGDRPAEAQRVLVKFVDTEPAAPPDRLSRMRLMADKLDELGRRLVDDEKAEAAAGLFEAAEKLYRECVDQQPLDSLRLATFLARRGRIDEALAILDNDWRTGTPASTAQALVVLVKNPKATSEQLARANRILEAAMEHHDRPVPLLLVMADFRGAQERYQESEACYREIIRKRPGDAIAMNNLAVLLALQGQKADEALELINGAIKIAGPVSAMLDSRASVHLARGKPQEAIADLTAAIREQPAAARYFHLAQAYDMANRRKEAAEAMKQALESGLTEDELHPLERPALGRLKKLVE